MERYIALDVETPNSANDRISALGLTVIEAGAVTQEFYRLVNPETFFHPFNVALTGITPELVAGEPAFPALWPEIEPILSSGLLVAHNAPFDLSVLSKCLKGYGIPWKSCVRYVCTCQMGRRLLPRLENHRLNTLCAYWGLELEHHHAGSDSRACGELLLRYLEAGASVMPFMRTYDLFRSRTVRQI